MQADFIIYLIKGKTNEKGKLSGGGIPYIYRVEKDNSIKENKGESDRPATSTLLTVKA